MRDLSRQAKGERRDDYEAFHSLPEARTLSIPHEPKTGQGVRILKPPQKVKKQKEEITMPTDAVHLKGKLVRFGLVLLMAVTYTIASIYMQPAKGEEGGTSSALSYVGKLSLSPRQGEPGTLVKVHGSGFHTDAELEILWQRFQGSWKVEGAEFYGREYKQELDAIAKVRPDQAGTFEAELTVPEGFGFIHDVIVAQDGKTLNKAAFEVAMEASIFPRSGPVGSPIRVELKGVGWRPLENSWVLLYDNKFTGWLSAVTTRGVARAVVPATGVPGKHILRIVHGAFTFPYMNMQQSPRPERPTFTFEFTVTDGSPILPPSAQSQALPEESGIPRVGQGEPVIWADPRSGPVGTSVTVYGSDLPSDVLVDLAWYRVVGNRVSAQSWSEESSRVGSVRAEKDGTFQFSFPALDDLGGAHRIEAQIDGRAVAETKFVLTPSAFSIEPTSGPAGTVATIHLKGVGWSETANIYTVVYDNAYVGYACGFNSQGDVTINLPMAGGPGWHFIDLYPAIYKGEDIRGVNNFRIPQLTYQEDHPGERLPAFRFAYDVVG
jgi:hypothetical protein